MLISTLGIVPSLSFFYSKVGKSMYEEIAKIYDGKVDVSKLNMEMLIKENSERRNRLWIIPYIYPQILTI